MNGSRSYSILMNTVYRFEAPDFREGAKIIGIYAGQDDGGASTFFAKKNEGA